MSASRPPSFSSLPSRFGGLLGAGVALAGAGLAFRSQRDLGLLGFDSYPILVTSRLGSWGELPGRLAEPLMDGRYSGLFWRPLLELTFMLDHALWGLEPMGYQLTSAILFAACAAALFHLARRAAGPGAPFAPWVVLGVFLFHPGHAEVLPVPPRRAEFLAGGLLAAALAMQVPPLRPRRHGAAGLLSFLAMLSKETALVAPAFGAVLGASAAPAGSAWRRAGDAARAASPHAVAMVAALGARVAVLGGLGGHSWLSGSGVVEALALVPLALAHWVLPPLPGGLATALPLLAGILLATTVAIRLRDGDERSPAVSSGAPGVLAAVGATWLVVFTGVHALAGRLAPWYTILPVAGFSLILGALSETARAGLQGTSVRRRVAAAGGALALAAILVASVAQSPLLRGMPTWQRAEDARLRFFDTLALRLRRAGPGSVVTAPPLPRWAPSASTGPPVGGAAILAPYSVQAWCDLRFPKRRIRVVEGATDDRPAADEVVVRLLQRRRGFEKRRAPF